MTEKTVVGKYEEKVKFLCLLCPSKPGVFLSADLSTSANLKTHIKRRHPDRCSEFEEYRKNKPKRRQTSHPKMYNRQVKNVRRFFPSEGNWYAVE
ncbi:hypothetical protein Avbf_15908 [Armadillidium vulgare]|nr:hypothetical protein Avbf_15908 [Armadillidium vulgare]